MEAATRASNVPGILQRIQALPTIPVVAEQVGRLINDPRSDARAVAEVMRGDPALTAKVLRLVNSPYYAIPGGVSDVPRAISFLGFSTLYQLVLTASVFRIVEGTKERSEVRQIFKHSLACAAAAESLAELLGHPAPGECFTAGLLHDIGKIALMHVAEDDFVSALVSARRQGIPMREAELEAGLPSHDAAGLHLARSWRFPLSLQAVIGYHHHNDPASRSGLARHLNPSVDLVSLADTIARRVVADPLAPVPEMPDTILERMGLLPSVETRVHDALWRKVEKSQSFMEILCAA